MDENAIEVYQPAGFLAPVISVKAALAAYQAKKELVEGILRKGVDFDTIPGSEKPSLLKPGAEKVVSFFALRPVFRDAATVEDWTGEHHGGEPFFYYRRSCELWHNGALVASADGSCSSWEKKYRYRSADRKCPQCGKETIIKGQQKYGGGWICFAKKGGCGAKFADNDPAITQQVTGQIANPDVADLVNTILKMADKRALVAATLIATGMSEYFTQDIEDYVTGELHDAPAPQPSPAHQPAQTKPMSNGLPRPWQPDHLKEMIAKSAGVYAKKGEVPTDAQRNMIAANIEQCFAGSTDSAQLRRMVLEYLTGFDSVKNVPGEFILALRGWLDVKQDSGGEWIPSAVSAQEAGAIADMLLENQEVQE